MASSTPEALRNAERVEEEAPSTPDLRESEVTLESSEADTKTDDELFCDVCEDRSQTKGGLKIYIGIKHKDIPQLDGDIQTERDTDDWWENNSTVL